MSDELPNYFDSFQPNRVSVGKVVPREEMIRRLAHYLQVPQKYGGRLYSAFENMFSDALMHGEGIKIRNAGHLCLVRAKTDTVRMFHKDVERVILYKYKWSVSSDAKRFLRYISDLDKKGVVSDYFQDPQDSEFQIDTES